MCYNEHMRHCNKCNTQKEDIDFNIRRYKSGNTGFQFWCKQCNNLYHKERYAINEDRRTKVAKSGKKNRDLVKNYIREYLKTHPCIDCGQADIRCLHFDHVRETKSFNIANAFSLKKVEEEIKKCEVRCANCHMKKTSDDFGWHRSLKT